MKPRLVPSLAILILAFSASMVLSDDTSIKKLVKENVETLNEATMKGDYAKVADLTHPKILEMAGGREKMISLLEKTLGEMKSKGFEIKSVKVAEPSDLVKQADELYVYVPFEMIVKYTEGKIISFGYVIGLSVDQGKSWTFVNSNSSENLKKILPNLPAALKLPETKEPVIEKD